MCQCLLTANINSHKINTRQWRMQCSRPHSIPMTNQLADNAVETETHVSSGDQRVASLRAAVGGVLNWNTRHKFRPNHLIVSVLLERISSHAKLLWVLVLSCSLPSCFVFVAVVCVCWIETFFQLYFSGVWFCSPFQLLFLVNYYFCLCLKGTECDWLSSCQLKAYIFRISSNSHLDLLILYLSKHCNTTLEKYPVTNF